MADQTPDQNQFNIGAGFPNLAQPGGIASGYGNPQQIQQAYLQMLREKSRQQQQMPIRSWTQVAAGMLDTLADQMQLNRMMGGARTAAATEAESMFPGEGGHATPDGADAPAGVSGATPTPPMGNQAAPGGAITQAPGPSPLTQAHTAMGMPQPAGMGDYNPIPGNLTYPMGAQPPGGQGGGAGGQDGTLVPAMNISSRGETSRTGAAALSNISADTAGSKSYGPWGLNSKTGSLAGFVQANPQLGITAQPGTAEFDQQWKAAAARNPDAMLSAHQDWYKSRYLNPVASTLTSAGVNPQIAGDPRVQAYMADRTLQMGTVGQQRVLAAARDASTPADFMHRVSMSDHANIGSDFRTYLRDYPQNARGLGNRIDWRNGASMMIGGQPPGGPAGGVQVAGPPMAPAVTGGAPGSTQTPTPTPGAPGASGAPAASAGATGGMIGQSGYFVPENQIPRPPMMSREQAKQAYMAAAMRGDQAGAKQIHDDYIKQFQPIELDVPGGKVRVNPSNHRDQHFIPTLEKGTEKGPGGIESPMLYTVGPEGRATRVPITGPQAAPSPASSPATPSTAGGAAPTASRIDDPYPENGTMAEKIDWNRRNQQATEGGKELQTGASHALQGAQGLGNIGARITPIADDAGKIISDPNWRSGGLASTRMALERLKNAMGMPSNAAPMEVLNQARKTMLTMMQEGAKSGTTITGEAARLFASEISTMSGMIPEENATEEGQRSGFKSVSRLGKHWSDNADAVEEWVSKQKNQLPNIGIHKFLRDREKEFHMYAPEEVVPEQAGPPAPSAQAAPPAAAASPAAPAPATPSPASVVRQPFSPSLSDAAMGRGATGAAPGGGPAAQAAYGTANPIAQALMTGDNPLSNPDVAKSFNSANAGAAAIGTLPLTGGIGTRTGRFIFGGHDANAAQWLARLIAGGGGEEGLKSIIKHLMGGQ